MLSVVFPDARVPDVEALAKAGNVEVIFIDKNQAETRAGRLNLGFEKAQGSMILFHHPRSRLTSEGVMALFERRHEKIWGGFTHGFDRRHPLLTYTSWYSNRVRPRISGILYLDHCIFFHRDLWTEKIPEVPIFEDTLLSYNLRRHGPPVVLPFSAMTSAVRYDRNGIVKQAVMNQILKIGFHLGWSAESMNRWYERRVRLNS